MNNETSGAGSTDGGNINFLNTFSQEIRREDIGSSVRWDIETILVNAE
jgi:hypothetical protein